MTGTASSQVRSAYIAEVTPGTIPATPAFTTLHRPAMLVAKPDIIEGRSLIAGGARLGQGFAGIPVTGSLESPLVYGVYDAFFASLLQGAWATNVLTDAKQVSTVAVENTIPAGVDGTATMLRYRGVEAIGGTLNLTAKAAAQLSLNLIGRGSDIGTTTAIVGSTYVDPTEFDPLSSGADVGTITMAGYTPDCMQSLEIAFTFEGRDPQERISSDDLCGVTRGDFLPVMTANIFVETNFLAMYNAARARHAAFAVTVPLGSVTTEKYTLVFPSCHFGSTEIDMSATNVFQKVEIRPEYSTSLDYVLAITRAVV